MQKQAAAIFLFTILHAAAFAQRAAVAPYRHPLKQPASAAAALKEYEELLGKVKAVGTPAATETPNAASTDEPFDCPGLDGSIRKCVAGEGLRYYVGEYLPYASNSPAVVPDSTDSSSLEGGGAEPGWVPVEKVVGGEALLKGLEDSLAKKELEGCDGDLGECRAVVEAVSAGEGERVLAVCDMAHVGAERGSVRNCVAVAVVAPGASYLRSVVAYTPESGAPAKPDEWDAVVVYRLEQASEGTPLPDLKTVLDTVRGGLESGKFKLKVGLSPADAPVHLVGVADTRFSPLNEHLDNVWEKVSLVIDAHREEGVGGGITLKASFSVLLRSSHLPSSQPADFRPPTDAEVRLYENALAASIRLPLFNLCGVGSRWREPTTLTCGRSRLRARPE